MMYAVDLFTGLPIKPLLYSVQAVSSTAQITIYYPDEEEDL